VGIPCDVSIPEGNVDRILGHGRSVDGEVGFLVSALLYPKSKIMPPQFFARSAIKTERQQR
jgi:hypothetical protein